MTEAEYNISRLNSGGLIVNYRCTSKCRHCLYGCSGAWPDDYITPEQTKVNLSKIRSLGCRSVHVGGGEPFMHPDGLIGMLETARECGVGIDYIETNSSWFNGSSDASALLKELRSVGVDTLLLSISPFHTEYIPFVRVKELASACSSSGISVFPWIMDFAGDAERMGSDKRHSLEEYCSVFGEGYIERAIHLYGLTERGRALKLVRPYRRHMTVEETLKESSETCFELAGTSHFHVDLYGNYLPGLCSGMAIDVGDLGRTLDAERYKFLGILYSDGIEGLLKEAVSEYGFAPRDTGYISKCDLCYHIRRYLVHDCKLNARDLKPENYYKEEYT